MIMDDAPEPRITLHPHARRVRVVIDGTELADTTRAIELRERGYPPRQYLPRSPTACAPTPISRA